MISNRHRTVKQNGPFLARRAELHEAAAQLFYEKGYDGTTVQDIAERVGLLKGSIYHYIGSKGELLFELLREDHERSLAELVEVLANSSDDAPAKLRAAVRSAATNAAERPWRPATFVHEHRYLKEDHARVILTIRRRYQCCFVDVLKSGQQEGTFRRDIDPALVAIAALSMINAIASWYQPGHKWSAQTLAESYADLIETAVRV